MNKKVPHRVNFNCKAKIMDTRRRIININYFGFQESFYMIDLPMT